MNRPKLLFVVLMGLTLACYPSVNIITVDESSPEPYARQIIDRVKTEFFPTETEPPTAVSPIPTIMPKPTNTLAAPFIPTTVVIKPTDQPQTAAPTGRIIYTCQVDKNPSHDQICAINADGSGFMQLTHDMKTAHFYPSWAPDGNSFYYAGVHNNQFKIFVSDLKGNAELLANIPGDLFAPAASPDGSKVAFTRHVSDTGQYITVYNRETEMMQDVSRYFDAKDPTWSPDGSKLLFTSLEDDTPQLYFINADGSFPQKITELSGLRGRSDWAADLAIATYTGEFEDHNREIVLLTLGGEPQNITQGGDNLAPSFSPDGQWIVFMSYRDHFWEADGCELYIMRRDGTDIRRLTDNEYCDYQPRWSK